MRRRLLNILIALDQFVYVLLTLGHGSPDETMSAAMAAFIFSPFTHGLDVVVTGVDATPSALVSSSQISPRQRRTY